MGKSVNKWVLVAYMQNGDTRYIGPFNTRGRAQEYATRIENVASYEANNLVKPFD